MTVGAGVLVERTRVSLDVTILTNERGPIGSGLVGVQFEVHCIVIELGRSPIGRGVTGGAVLAKLTRMRVILLVTGETVGGCVLKVGVLVTRLARDIRVSAFKLECKLRVIYSTVPTLCGMTGSTVGTKLTGMFIIFGVTGETIRRDPFVFVIDMTELTLNGIVFADQFETGKVVIELGRLAPSFRRMTDTAFSPKLTLMLIVFLMAVVTFLRGSL